MQVDAPSIGRTCQQSQQFSKMDAKAGGSHPPFDSVQSYAAQSFFPPEPALKVGEASTDCSQSIGQTQVRRTCTPLSHRVKPAPISRSSGLRSRTMAWMPCHCKAAAAASPRMPPPMMLTWSVCFSISSLSPVLHRCIWYSQMD